MSRTPLSFIPSNPLSTLRASRSQRSTSPNIISPAICAQQYKGTSRSPIDPALFRIHKTVMPADTDYSSALWHGTYLRYLEEARVCFLLHVGDTSFETVVREHATDVVVHELSIKYLSPARMGDEIAVTVDVLQSESSVRIPVESKFIEITDDTVLATARVTLVAIDTATGRPRRKLPSVLRKAFGRGRKVQVESE